MPENRNKRYDESQEREQLFQKRLAELQARNNQFPWNMSETPDFDIPKAQSKLFAERSIEDPSLSDEEVERRALLDLNSYNFWSFYKRLNYEVRRANRYKRPLSLLFVTIDSLSAIVDSYGLRGESAVVLRVGKVLLSCVRDVDIAGRCRDDCFGVILPETPRQGAEIAAERMRTKMEDLATDFEKDQIVTSVTVGGASLEGEVLSADVLIELCVQTLKTGITAGGNTVIFPI